MKVKRIKIENYKTVKKLTVGFYDDITLIVGKNNIGKSNVLKAIEIFYKCVEEGEPKQLLESEDFRKNTNQILLTSTFSEVDELVNNLKNSLISEAKKRRSNQERIKYYEILYRTFQLLKNKYHEFDVKISIQRADHSDTRIEIPNPVTSKRKETYESTLTKRHYAERHLQEVFKEKQNNLKNWYEYKWLAIEKKGDKKVVLKYDDKEKVVVEEKISELAQETKISNALEYIKLTQKFFYVPAYRGGKNERDEAINRLFDIIIDDLVVSKKGLTTEFDRVTDAIWGTGKNTNKYNLQSVISERLKTVTDNLKTDSISSITDIEFKTYSSEETRRRILKIMLGTSNIFLNDGIKTSFESKGTGIQSSFMITLMKALSQIEFEENTSILLVIEEPEAFAHPQLIREIIDKISREFSNGLFQFIVTTHSPVIVNFVNSNRIQRLKLKSDTNETHNVTSNKNKLSKEDWNLINRIGDVNLSEIVFADLVLFVEGEGDKIVFEKLLKILLPDFYSKISVISLNGNNQIFKVLKLLNYYDINWLMIFDKDSFITREHSASDITTQSEIMSFFEQFQIDQRYLESFKAVINNQNVSRIKISKPTNIKIGDTLSKINQVCDDLDDNLKDKLLEIVSKKLSDDVFPEKDAINIIKELNQKMFDNGIPFYSLTSELEGMVINPETKDITRCIYKKYYYESYVDFEEKYKNASEQEYLKALRKSFGSKTHSLEKISGAAKDRKKPHIPIEIVSKYIENLELNERIVKADEVKRVFPDLDYLCDVILNRLKNAE